MSRLNWKIAGPVTILGMSVIGAGLALVGFTTEAWAQVLITVGTAVALVVILVFLEQRLVDRAAQRAEAAAVEVVEQATSDLRERLVRLENLDEAQANECKHRKRKDDRLIQDVLTNEITPSAVGELLVTAQNDRLLDGEHFRVRTSSNPSCHVLYFLPLQADNGVHAIWIDFEPFEFSDETLKIRDSLITVPSRGRSTVMWTNDSDAAEIASELEAGLERKNEPPHDFAFRQTLLNLVRSVQIIRQARAAPAGSPTRLRGDLRLLINEDWVITSFGLEALNSPLAFEVLWSGFRGRRAGAAAWYPTSVTIDQSEVRGQGGLWDEAVRWVTEREDWQILEPGDRPPHPMQTLLRSAEVDAGDHHDFEEE